MKKAKVTRVNYLYEGRLLVTLNEAMNDWLAVKGENPAGAPAPAVKPATQASAASKKTKTLAPETDPFGSKKAEPETGAPTIEPGGGSTAPAPKYNEPKGNIAPANPTADTLRNLQKTQGSENEKQVAGSQDVLQRDKAARDKTLGNLPKTEAPEISKSSSPKKKFTQGQPIGPTSPKQGVKPSPQMASEDPFKQEKAASHTADTLQNLNKNRGLENEPKKEAKELDDDKLMVERWQKLSKIL